MRIISLIAAYNERRFIAACLEHLSRQGVQAYLIDNESTDETAAIARGYLGGVLIGLETLPRHGRYYQPDLLRRKEELALELEADWFIHQDPDEFRLSPRPDQTLAEALAEEDAKGYNAVNFLEFTFLPTREEPDHDHGRFLETMRWYYPFLPAFPHRLNAWKKQPQRVDLATHNGHRVHFPGLKMSPESFRMRHYLFLSGAHFTEKYGTRIHDVRAVAAGRHGWRARVSKDMSQALALPSREELRLDEGNGVLDPSNPRKIHLPGAQIKSIAKERFGKAPEIVSNQPPAPFIVGLGRSGTTLLRLMLDAHPGLAIPPETHFLPDLIRQCRNRADTCPVFLEKLRQAQNLSDFHLSWDSLEQRVGDLEPFSLGEGIRVFYRLYAERFGKARWGDKTPGYEARMKLIGELLPEARFIHVIRDGRDRALSLRKVYWGAQSVTDMANQWVRRIRAARRQARHLPHYLEIRYEDLVREPEQTLRKVCEYIELDFDPVMLEFHRTGAERIAELEDLPPGGKQAPASAQLRRSIHPLAARPPQLDRIGVWKQEFTPEEVQTFEQVAGPLLRKLGYEIRPTRPRAPVPPSGRWSRLKEWWRRRRPQ